MTIFSGEEAMAKGNFWSIAIVDRFNFYLSFGCLQIEQSVGT